MLIIQTGPEGTGRRMKILSGSLSEYDFAGILFFMTKTRFSTIYYLINTNWWSRIFFTYRMVFIKIAQFWKAQIIFPLCLCVFYSYFRLQCSSILNNNLHSFQIIKIHNVYKLFNNYSLCNHKMVCLKNNKYINISQQYNTKTTFYSKYIYTYI